MRASSYRLWRRLHVLSGVLPVGIFIVLHFLTNASAIAGREAFLRTSERLERIPVVRLLEVLGIAIPILFHVVLGILLGNTAQGVDARDRYPRPWMAGLQRATGGFLVVFTTFHVFGIRLSPDLLSGKLDLFTVTRRELEHLGMLVFHVLGVLAASIHFGIGLLGVAGYWREDPLPAESAGRLRWAIAATVVLALVGLNALFAFVSRPARWLEP